MKYIPRIFFFCITVFPIIALAHVKWFAEEKEYVRPYEVTDIHVISAFIGVVFLLCIGIYLEKKMQVSKKLHQVIEKMAPYVLSLASIGFGLAFIIFTIQGFIFAPNLLADGTLGTVMLILQGVAGMMILFGLYEKIGGLLILLLFTLGIGKCGSFEMLDTLEMVGFALYACIVGRPLWKIKEAHALERITHRIHAYGYPLLRVGVGLNLMVLGFTEKILDPGLTKDFLHHYNWNVMQQFGMSDYWFAFYAGVTEATFGLFFLFGLVTRTTTLTLAVFLVTTLYLLGPVELIGHLPHFSIVLVMIVLGCGTRFVLLDHKK